MKILHDLSSLISLLILMAGRCSPFTVPRLEPTSRQLCSFQPEPKPGATQIDDSNCNALVTDMSSPTRLQVNGLDVAVVTFTWSAMTRDDRLCFSNLLSKHNESATSFSATLTQIKHVLDVEVAERAVEILPPYTETNLESVDKAIERCKNIGVEKVWNVLYCDVISEDQISIRLLYNAKKCATLISTNAHSNTIVTLVTSISSAPSLISANDNSNILHDESMHWRAYSSSEDKYRSHHWLVSADQKLLDASAGNYAAAFTVDYEKPFWSNCLMNVTQLPTAIYRSNQGQAHPDIARFSASLLADLPPVNGTVANLTSGAVEVVDDGTSPIEIQLDVNLNFYDLSHLQFSRVVGIVRDFTCTLKDDASIEFQWKNVVQKGIVELFAYPGDSCIPLAGPFRFSAQRLDQTALLPASTISTALKLKPLVRICTLFGACQSINVSTSNTPSNVTGFDDVGRGSVYSPPSPPTNSFFGQISNTFQSIVGSAKYSISSVFNSLDNAWRWVTLVVVVLIAVTLVFFIRNCVCVGCCTK